jgi:hypothetical protein
MAGQPTLSTRDKNLLKDLIKVTTGEIPHNYTGSCPDPVEGPSVRDKHCKACRVILRAEKRLASL